MKTIFEMIIDGEVPSMKIYEDDNFIAFLDVEPKQKGHTLIVPKVKNECVLCEPDNIKESILKVGTTIANLIKDRLGAKGIKFVLNCGKEAGQEVFHTHLHVIPYYDHEEQSINNEDVLNELLK